MHRDIRDLLAYAGESFESIRLESSAVYATLLLQRAFERSIPDFARRVAAGSIARLEPPGSSAAAPDGSARTREDSRVWWRKPSCWRDDTTTEHGATAVCTVCGTSSSWYIPQLRTMRTSQRATRLIPRAPSVLSRGRDRRVPDYPLPTLEQRLELAPLLHASFFSIGWDLAVLDERRHAGRDAVRVSATRRGADARGGAWEYVDRYELLVDHERGVLLRCAGIVDGEEAGVFSAGSVRFDEPIPDAMFVYQPPDGTTILGA